MNVPQIGSVSFNGKKIEQELDGIVQDSLPFIASKTLEALSKQVMVDLRKEMKSKFKNYAPFTDKSLETYPRPGKHRKDRLFVEISHKDVESKGNAAADYLKPQVIGGKVYETRFQKRIKIRLANYPTYLDKINFSDFTIPYMLPLHSSPAAKLNAQGRIQAGQYTEALYGIKAMADVIDRRTPESKKGLAAEKRGTGKYFFVPRNAIQKGQDNRMFFRPGAGGNQALPSGIYRVMSKNNPVQLFQLLDKIPTVSRRYDFRGAAESSIASNLNQIFNEQAAAVIKRQFR